PWPSTSAFVRGAGAQPASSTKPVKPTTVSSVFICTSLLPRSIIGRALPARKHVVVDRAAGATSGALAWANRGHGLSACPRARRVDDRQEARCSNVLQLRGSPESNPTLNQCARCCADPCENDSCTT